MKTSVLEVTCDHCAATYRAMAGTVTLQLCEYNPKGSPVFEADFCEACLRKLDLMTAIERARDRYKRGGSR